MADTSSSSGSKALARAVFWPVFVIAVVAFSFYAANRYGDTKARVVFITAPLAYLLLGQNIIASSASMIFAYALPHLFHAIWTNSRLNGRFRYTFWGEIYESVYHHLLKNL